MIPENLTMEKVVEKNPLVRLGGQYWPHGSGGTLLWASPTPAAPSLPSSPLLAAPATALCHLCGEPGEAGVARAEGSEHDFGESGLKLVL
jgi:hypothetical protein